MAKTAQINISINTQNAIKSIADLDNELKGTVSTIGDLKMTVESLQQELESTEYGTERFNELKSALIEANTQLKNYELSIEALDNEQLASELKSVAGGFMDMAGGMALVGSSSKGLEELVQTIAQIEGATKIVTGSMEAFSSLMKLQSNIALRLTAIQNALAAAQLKGGITGKAAAVGMKILNAVMNANPVFLIIAGITALVGALAWFMSSTDDAAEKNEAFNKTFEKQIDLQERAAAANKKSGDQALELAEALGASEEELHKIRIRNLAVEEIDRKRSIKNIKEGIQNQRKIYKDALDEGDEELAEQIKGEIESNRAKYKDLIAQNGDYNHKLKIENANYSDHVKTENEKQVEDDKKTNEERLNNYKKYLADRVNAARTLEDLNLQLLTEGEIKEIEVLNSTYRKLIEDTKTNENLIKTEKDRIISSYEQLREKKEREIRKKYIDEEEKAGKEASEARGKAIEQLPPPEFNLKIPVDDIEAESFTLGEKLKVGFDTLGKDISQSFKDNWVNALGGMLDAAANIMGEVMNIVSQIQERNAEIAQQEREDAYTAETETLNAQLANREISQKQFDAKMALLEQKKEQQELTAKRKAFKQQKQMAIVSAIMGMSQGIIQGMANAFPLNIIMAALAAAVGTANLAIIGSQKFKAARGGIVPGMGPSNIDSVDALLAPGEAVINAQSASMFPQTLSKINEAGGGVSLAPEPVTNTSSSQSIFSNNKPQQEVRAYVVENDITEKQKRVNRYEVGATFG
jgi:hypothetical protein